MAESNGVGVELIESIAPSFSSSGRVPTTLKPSAPPTLPLITISPIEAKDIRAGERGWRNIPDCVRDVLSSTVESTTSLRSATIALAQAIGKRAGFAEVATALNSKASVEQLERLARYVGRDVLGRLSEPCPGHVISLKNCSSLEQDVARLQAIIESQDRTLVAATRELGALRSSLQRREAHDSSISLNGISKEAHQKIIEDALERAKSHSKEHADLSLDRAKLHSENLYAKRSDLMDAFANDIRVMSNKLQTLSEECEPRDLRMARIEASLRKITDEIESQGGSYQGKENGNQNGVVANITTAAESAVRSRMAMISTAIERQLSLLRSDVEKSLKSEVSSLREELETAVKGKLNKTDLIRALSARPTTEFVKEHVRLEVSALQTTIERKAELDEVKRLRLEVSHLKEAMKKMEEMLMRSENQSRINTLFASSAISVEREGQQ